MAVAVHFNANWAFDLATYASIVLTLARDIKGSVWAKYDRRFRQAAAVNPQLPWHRWEQDISMMSVTESTSLANLSTTIHGDMQKVEQGVLPLCPVPLPARVLCMPGAGHITRDCPLGGTSPKAPAAGRPVKP